MSGILSHKSGLVFIWRCGNQSSLYLRICVFPFIFEAVGLVEDTSFVSGWGEAQAPGFSVMNSNDLSGPLSETGRLLEMAPVLCFLGLRLGTGWQCGLALVLGVLRLLEPVSQSLEYCPFLITLYCLMHGL